MVDAKKWSQEFSKTAQPEKTVPKIFPTRKNSAKNLFNLKKTAPRVFRNPKKRPDSSLKCTTKIIIMTCISECTLHLNKIIENYFVVSSAFILCQKDYILIHSSHRSQDLGWECKCDFKKKKCENYDFTQKKPY